MTILLTLTAAEADDVLRLVDLALKHPNGGVLALKASNCIVDKINAAVAAENSKNQGMALPAE